MFPEPTGRDAELLLHRARANLRFHIPLLGGDGRIDQDPWSRDDVEAFAWIAGLARSGHWGAHLVVQAAQHDRLAMYYVAQSHPAVAADLAQHSADVAYVAALAECRRPGPDWNRVEEWLEKGEREGVARGLREARRTLGRLRCDDVWVIDHAIASGGEAGELLLELSRWRRIHGDAKGATALLDSACRMGSRKALAKSLEEWRGSRTKPEALLGWIDAYEGVVPAAEAREALRLAAPLAPEELARIGALLVESPPAGGLLRDIAKGRATGDPEMAARLLDRAYQLGADPALEAHWRMNRPRAGPLRAFLDEWLARFPGMALETAQRFKVAVHVETGGGPKGMAPDAPAAMRLYAHAVGIALDDDGAPGPRLSHFIASRLDPAKSQVVVPLPALALRWYEHGIDRGSSACFDDWLIACASGALGLTPDPEAALAMSQRWKAAADRTGQNLIFTDGLDRANGIATQCQEVDPALARRWLAPGAFLGYRKSLELLANLGSRGQ